MKYYISNQEVDESTYQDYMVKFEKRKNYVQMVLNNEVEINSIPEEYKDEIIRAVSDETLLERATAYDILMGVGE